MSHPTDNPALSGAVLPTFFYYAIPSIVGLLALTTSNLVDGVFVGNYVGGEALAAITLLIPFFTVLFAIGLMFAIGGSVGAGKCMGADEEKAASDVFSQTMMATLATAALFAVASLPLEQTLFALLKVPVELSGMVREYLGVIRWVLIPQLTIMVLYYFVRADGHPILATSALVVGALGNVLLDALFVIGLEMGLRGAAYAVLISQIAQGAVLCRYFFSPARSLRFVWRQRDWSPLSSVSVNGVSEFINEVSAGAILWLINGLLLVRAGVQGVASFSVVNYFIFLSLMLSYGVADALHLLVSQNFGARRWERIARILGTAVACSLAIGIGLALVLTLFREPVTGWFLEPGDVEIKDGAEQLVGVIWPLFLVNGTNVILSCYLTAIHRSKASALVASMRGLILPAILLLLIHALMRHWSPLSTLPGWSVLWALPIAEWLTFTLALTLCHRHRPAVLGLCLRPRPLTRAVDPEIGDATDGPVASRNLFWPSQRMGREGRRLDSIRERSRFSGDGT